MKKSVCALLMPYLFSFEKSVGAHAMRALVGERAWYEPQRLLVACRRGGVRLFGHHSYMVILA